MGEPWLGSWRGTLTQAMQEMYLHQATLRAAVKVSLLQEEALDNNQQQGLDAVEWQVLQQEEATLV